MAMKRPKRRAEMQNDELRRIQLELRAARDQYAELYELAPVGHLRLDDTGAIKDANVAACALLDLSRDELRGRPLSVFVAPDDRAVLAQHLGQVFLTEARQTCELRLLRSDGAFRYVRLDSAAPPRHRGPRECQTVVMNLAERRKLEAQLELSRAESRAMVESAMDAIITVDDDQRIVVFNLAAEQMFRCRAADALGGGLERFLPARAGHGEPTGAAERTWVTRTAAGRLRAVQAVRADGSEFPAETSISRVEVGGRRLLTVIVRDVTDRVRAEAEVRKRQEQLASSHMSLMRLAGRLMTAQETERRRIASDLHDDLGQRLAAIQVDLDLLRRRLEATSGPLAAEIEGLRAQLVSVSDDLHGLARELHPAVLEHLGLQIALRDLCRDFERRERVATAFRHRGVPPALPKDVELCLYRIAQEALRNVVKHAAVSSARVSLQRTPRGIGLCVRDPGRGFDPGVARGSSTGLGLRSMEERMRSVQGKFSVRSRPGQGTHVHAWAPLWIPR